MDSDLVLEIQHIYRISRQYHRCIQLMAICIVMTFIAPLDYFISRDEYSFILLAIASSFFMFALVESKYIAKTISGMTSPILNEVAQQGSTEEIKNPDRLLYALELCLIELESGYCVSRAAHNINVITARLAKLNYCKSALASKFYRVFVFMDRWRPAEYICGLWALSLCACVGVFLHLFLSCGQYSVLGIVLTLSLVVPLYGLAETMGSISIDLYMSRLYYEDPKKHSESFISYVNSRFEDAEDEAV